MPLLRALMVVDEGEAPFADANVVDKANSANKTLHIIESKEV